MQQFPKTRWFILPIVVSACFFALLGNLFAAGIPNSQQNPAISWNGMPPGSATTGGITTTTTDSEKVAMASSYDGSMYVAWQEELNSDTEIYVKKWNGNAWVEVGQNSASNGGVSNNSGDSIRPAIAVSNLGYPVVAWRDNSSGYWDTYVRSWNGAGWVELGSNSATGTGISNLKGNSEAPLSLDISPSGTIFVAWDDQPDGQSRHEIFVAQWKDSQWQSVGANSTSGTGISNTSGESWSPDIHVVNDDAIFVAWHDHTPTKNQIYAKKWNGNSWNAIGPDSASNGGVSNTSGDSRLPSLLVDKNNTVFVVWQDNQSGTWQIYGKKWGNNTWSNIGSNSASGMGISQTPANSYRPQLIEGNGSQKFLAWYTNKNTTTEVYVKEWNGSQWNEFGNGSASGNGISNNTGYSSLPAIALNTTTNMPVIAWEDNTSGNYEIYLLQSEETTEPTATPSPTLVPTNTQTPVFTATATPVPSSTATGQPTATPTPSRMATLAATQRPTQPPSVNLPFIVYQLPPTSTPIPTATPDMSPPITVGFVARWDTRGFIRTGESFDVGHHREYKATGFVDPNTLRLQARDWYKPNPEGWEGHNWIFDIDYSTGRRVSSTYPYEDEWLWGNPWLMPYDVTLVNGGEITISGVKFSVIGPSNGQTVFGAPIQFWELKNKDAFTLWDGDDGWVQIVQPGNAILRYDHSTRLLIYENVLRHYYNNGHPEWGTVQYIEDLTSSNLYPGYPHPTVTPVSPYYGALRIENDTYGVMEVTLRGLGTRRFSTGWDDWFDIPAGTYTIQAYVLSGPCWGGSLTRTIGIPANQTVYYGVTCSAQNQLILSEAPVQNLEGSPHLQDRGYGPSR